MAFQAASAAMAFDEAGFVQTVVQVARGTGTEVAEAQATLLETVLNVVAGAQTEIIIFLIAVCAHLVIFGNYRFSPGAKGGKRKVQESTKVSETGTTKLSSLPAPAAIEYGQALGRCVTVLLRDNAGRAEAARELGSRLQNCPPKHAQEALAGLLRGLGAKVTAPILGAVRDIVARQSQPLEASLGEAVVQGYLRLRLQDEFEAVLQELEALDAVAPSVSVAALKSAIKAGNFEGAMGHLRRLTPCWRELDGKETSAAPQAMLQQLLKMAVDNCLVEELMDELQQLGLLTPWVVGIALVETTRRGEVEAAALVEQRARAAGLALTAAAYEALVKRAETVDEALRLLEEAFKNGAANQQVFLAVLESVPVESAAAPAVIEAVLPLLRENPAPEVAAAVLCLVGKGQETEAKVLELFEERFAAVNLSCNPEAMRCVAQATLRRRRAGLLRRLMAVSTDASAQVNVIKVFGSEGRFQDAAAVFNACPSKAACHFNALLDACVECKDAKAAELLLEEASAAGMADVVTYNTFIKAHLQGGDLHRAHEAVATMRKLGFQPNIVTFNELVHATIKSDLEAAWSLVAEMGSCGLRPNHITCSILLKSIQPNSRASDVERALAVVDAMGNEVDEVLLSSVLEACVRSGRSDLLVKQLRRLGGSKRVEVKGAQTYGSIIRAFGVIRDVEGAWGAWKDMKARNVAMTSITLGCMVEAVAANGNPDEGLQLIREAMDSSQHRALVNAVIYCSVLKGFSHQKNFPRVWEVYEEMRSEKMQFSIVTYNTLVDAMARSGEISRALPLLEEMAKDGIEPNIITFSAMIKGYCQENKLDSAFKLMEHMKKSLQLRPDEITYNTLLDGCARQGLFDRGMAVLEDMQAAGVRPSNFTLSVLVKLASRGGKLERAFGLCDELSKQYRLRLNVHVYSNLVQACTMHGDLPRGLEVLERMLRERVLPDARTYTLLLRSCVSNGSAEDAAGLLRSAMGVENGHPRLASFQQVQIRGGLPADLIAEVLEGMAGRCRQDTLAMQLLQELRGVPGLHLDPRLAMNITGRALRNSGAGAAPRR